jgi:WD40 repeat protein
MIPFFFLLYLASAIASLDANYKISRTYIQTCSSQECQSALNQCANAFNCFSETQCKRCLANYPECNSMCLSDLFDTHDYLTVNGQDYLICDASIVYQTHACKFICRSKLFLFGECMVESGYPICKCSSVTTLSPTSSSSLPITTPLPTQSQPQSQSTSSSMPAVSTTQRPSSVNEIITGAISYALCTLSNGDLVVGLDGGFFSVWSLSTGALLSNIGSSTITSVWSLAALTDGNIAISGKANSIEIRNPYSGSMARTLNGHTNSIDKLLLLQGGDLVSASYDLTVKIWNLATGSLKRTLSGHTAAVTTVCALASNDLASGALDNVIKIWNLADGTLRRNLAGHTASVISLTSLPSGDIASGSFDNTIRIWDVNTGSTKQTLTGHTNWISDLLVINGDLISSSGDKTVKVWSLATGTVKRTLTGHTDAITSLAALSDGRIASASIEKKVILWSLN